MWVRPATSWRRLRGVRVGVPALALVALLAGGCSGASDGVDTAPSTSAPTPAPTMASGSASSAGPAAGRPSRTRPPKTPTRPPVDRVGRASPRQLVGLVRIVASIGNDGRGETSTGMVLSGDGRVVTNNHAVAGATAVQATVMTSGRTYGARVVGGDPAHDIALLQLDGASRQPTVQLARRDVVVGARVTAVGDARGVRTTFTAATGTLLATGQTLVTRPTSRSRGERLTGVLLSSCNVVAGESGGPTYDARGRVVGMTTAAVRTRRGLFGIAIPVSTLRSVAGDLGRRAG